MSKIKITKKQQVINHFIKYPLATPSVVSEKFSMAMPAVYTLRKQALAQFIEQKNADIPEVVVEKGWVEAQDVEVVPDSSHNPTDHPLYPVLLAAINQAMYGKGERHGGAITPFNEQPWAHYAKMHGRGFLTGQATKKLEEAASTRSGEAFEQEVLGAIVYCGMALLKERGEV
jgi:hypothetical protein